MVINEEKKQGVFDGFKTLKAIQEVRENPKVPVQWMKDKAFVSISFSVGIKDIQLPDVSITREMLNTH